MQNSATDLQTLNAFKGWTGEPSWMKDLRRNAREQYAALGWPDAKVEEWHRTPVSRFRLETLVPGQPSDALPAFSPEPADSPYAGTLVIKDGAVVQRTLAPGLQEVKLTSLADAVVKGWGNEKAALTLKGLLEEPLKYAAHKTVPLHFALVETGAVLVVPQNQEIPKPFLIEIEENRDGVLTAPHLIVNAGRLSQASLLVKIGGKGKSVIDLGLSFLGDEGAVFALNEIQNLGPESHLIGHGRFRIGRDVHLTHWSASLGGGTVKSEADFLLDGQGADLNAKGMYFGSGDQHRDLRVTAVHQVPHTTSNTLYKGAVRDRSHTVFQGLIEVKPEAKGTDANLSNKNLILTDGARADSLPQLKIDNNDVKCAHGSSTGKVNEEEVYYLTARGFDRSEARLLIAEGLFSELIDAAPALLREELEAHVEEALADAGRGPK